MNAWCDFSLVEVLHTPSVPVRLTGKVTTCKNSHSICINGCEVKDSYRKVILLSPFIGTWDIAPGVFYRSTLAMASDQDDFVIVHRCGHTESMEGHVGQLCPRICGRIVHFAGVNDRLRIPSVRPLQSSKGVQKTMVCNEWEGEAFL